jgi:hypothetical protein
MTLYVLKEGQTALIAVIDNYMEGRTFDSDDIYLEIINILLLHDNIDVNIQKDSIGIYHFNIDTNKYGDWVEPIFNKIYEEAELACLEKIINIVESK